MAERLTFTSYTELVLARLHEAETHEPARQYFNVRELMSDLAGIVPDDWPWDAAQYLISEGLGVDLVSSGSPDTTLTPAGRIFVERGEGTGIIGEYQRSHQIVVVTGDANQVAVGHGQQVVQAARGDLSKEEVTELVGQAETRLADDGTLSEDDRADALADLQAIRGQLAKKNPNHDAVRSLAAGLAGVASIVDIVDKLRGAF